MGCLIEIVIALAYLVLMLFFTLIAFMGLGWWAFMLIPLILVGGRLNEIYDASRPGEFWHNVGRSVGRWMGRQRAAHIKRQQPPPSAVSFAPSLPDHVAAMRADLHPILASLYRTLHNPDSLRDDTVSGDVEHGLTEYIAALKNVFEAATQLKLKVFESDSCPASSRLRHVAGFSSAMQELIRVYSALLTQLAALPGDSLLMRLEHNQRANLQRLTMWLADIQLAIAHPRRILQEGYSTGGTSRAMLFNLHLPYPDDLAELETGHDMPAVYDAGHVLAILALEREDRTAATETIGPAEVTTPASSSRRRSSGGWLIPLAIGWIIGDWLFDDDPEDKV